jgi:hypothetical protein
MAFAASRDGPLAHFLPKEPAWCRKVGGDVLIATLAGRELSLPQRRQLHDAYRWAVAGRDGAEIGPAYPGPTHDSAKEARAALHAEYERIYKETLDYHESATQQLAA